jgi:hypothetical protein
LANIGFSALSVVFGKDEEWAALVGTIGVVFFFCAVGE